MTTASIRSAMCGGAGRKVRAEQLRSGAHGSSSLRSLAGEELGRRSRARTSDFRLPTSDFREEMWLCGYQKRRPLMTSCEIRSDEIRFEHDSPRVPRCEKLPRPILNRCRASKSEAGVAERWVPMQRSSLLTSDFRFRLANPEVCTGYRCRNVTSDFRLCCARAAGRENNNNY